MMSAGNSLECRYLGSGDLKQYRQKPLAENEALIYTTFTRDVPVLISGLLDCICSEELRERLPAQFSENDLASAIVGMVRNLPDMRVFNESFHSAELSADATVVAAIVSW